MVNIKSEAKGAICETNVQVHGSALQIIGELGAAIQQMHNIMRNIMRKNSETNAAAFRYLLIQLVANEASPLWDEPDLVPSDKTKAAGDLIADMLRNCCVPQSG